MSRHELNITANNGPLTSNSRIFGAVTGSLDQTPDVFSPDLILAFVRTTLDSEYASASDLSSLDDYVSAFTLQKDDADNTKWDGQDLIARGFAEATGPTDLVVYQQLQDAVLASTFDIPGLTVIDTVNSTDDLLLIYDHSALGYKSATPNQLISGLDPDLGAIAALSGTGGAFRTGSDTWALRTIAGTAGQISVANGDGVAGSPTISLPADIIVPTIITAPNTGLHLLDTDASHDLIVKPGSNLSADRTFTLSTGDNNRTLDISAADVTVSAYIATLLDDLTAGAAATTLGLGTGDSPQFTAIQLGHATDTTLSRVAGGRIAVEGNELAQLPDLASTSTSKGASLIGIEDSGSYFSATTVETALAYLGAAVAALDQAVILKGTWNASGGTFPGSGSAQAGWSYIVSVGGTVDGVAFTAGDRIIAILDNASTSTYASNWFKADYTDQVSSVAGRTGAVTLAQADISGLTTADSPQFTAVNVGNATDTTVTRVSAGLIAVEGDTVALLAAAQTMLNKTFALGSNSLSGSVSEFNAALTGADFYTTGGTDVAIADGGTGASTALAAFDALSPMTTRGDLITRGASNNARLAIGSANNILKSDGTDPSWTTISAILDSISSTQGAIIYRGASAWSALTPGTSGYLLQTQGAGANPQWASVSGTGDVTAAVAFGTDNRVIRSDGTGKGVQSTGITVDDSDNMSGVVNVNSLRFAALGANLHSAFGGL